MNKNQPPTNLNTANTSQDATSPCTTTFQGGHGIGINPMQLTPLDRKSSRTTVRSRRNTVFVGSDHGSSYPGEQAEIDVIRSAGRKSPDQIRAGSLGSRQSTAPVPTQDDETGPVGEVLGLAR